MNRFLKPRLLLTSETFGFGKSIEATSIF